jgi:hypothetical protein
MVTKKVVVITTFFILSFIFYPLYSYISLGISLGEPTGISLKIQQQKKFVYDFATSFATEDKYFYLHCDFFKYDYEKITSKELTGKLPLFYGIGIKLESAKEKNKIGVRFVGGIEYIFADIPFEIFFKIAPYIEIVPSTAVGIAPSIGIRYIFK